MANKSKKIYRHEQKYYINAIDEHLLRTKLSLTMARDRYANQNGEYLIRSLYFDDVYNTAMKEKMDGVEQRRKFRIRIYDFKDAVIKLECKEKMGPFIHKRSLSISRQDCDAIINCDPGCLLKYNDSLANEFYIAMRTRLMKPAVIVDYAREAFIGQFQDVRITFDRNLHTGVFASSLFDKDLPTVEALEESTTILEVKFNDHLAEYYRTLLQIDASKRSAISKYCICRKFER